MHKILIAEDELLLAAETERAVVRLGHLPVGPVQDCSQVRALLATNTIELVLMNVSVAGGCHGIATALHVCSLFATPILFLTTPSASSILQHIRAAQPAVFLVKPYTDSSLRAALELAMSKSQPAFLAQQRAVPTLPKAVPAGFSQFIFVRKGSEHVKLFLKDILYIESFQNYVRVYTDTDNFVVDSTLKNFGQKLPDYFLRTHRSYIVNLDNIKSYQESSVVLGRYQIPVSRSCQEELRIRINVLR
ncbi:LytTR family DNA-binding domain-containing protein [Hymenobacter sp. H14-R3]|uniref:LytR/AlgR family response regulator transcription factor n=1 Tax=Hymenobacter sp. H14-R3 TaxID=3046308 RepID=UPI0024BAE32C|nr:LytTR family DNA-binding domain-containing protein [Hymenobacter sp. H14-R3]MDJ0367132.1 LytTR family DNA-binding domain-containing protein [Hymenobacter sp. H14-R3]